MRMQWKGLGLLMAALLLASCSSTADEPTTVTTTTPPTATDTADEPATVTPTPTADTAPQYGGTLTISAMSHNQQPVPSWNLVAGPWDGGITIASPYFETLITGDVSMGQTGTKEHTFGARYVPWDVMTGGLAESWEILDNPLRIVFHLRQGVYWAAMPGIMEKREFVAEDVKFSFEKAQHHPWFGMEAIPTYHNWIKELVATDKYTFTMVLNSLYPDWGLWYGYGGPTPMNIIPKELYDAGIDDWENHVGLGTGPWLLSDYIDGSSITYTKNPDFRGTTVIDGKEYSLPFTDTFVHTLIPDESTRLAALRTGGLDIVMSVPWTYVGTLETSNPDLRRWSIDNWTFFSIGPRHDVPPFDQKDVRQALSMAIDRDFIVDELFGGFGLKRNWPQPIGWGETVHTPFDQYPAEVQRMYEYHPEEAKQLLTDAGYPDGFKTEVIYYAPAGAGVGDTVNILSLVKDYWLEHLNVELELIPLESAAFSANVQDRLLKALKGGFEASPTPLIGIEEWTLPDSVLNMFFWDRPELPGMYEDLYASDSDAEQSAILKEMERMIVTDMVSIFLPVPDVMRYAQPWVMNYEGEAMSGYRTSIGLFSIAWIDQNLKEDMGY